MNEIRPLETAEFHRLDGCMQGMSGLINQGQYDWYFDVKGFESIDSGFVIEELVKAAYPASRPESANITECTPKEMIYEINRQLSVNLPMWGDGTKTAPVRLLRNEVAMWRLLKDCIDYESARIFRYEPSDSSDGLRWGISGQFTFILINEGNKRCIVLDAGNTD